MTIFHNIEEAILDIKKGKMVIVVDDENRENEGDFVMAAEKITPDAINFMATEGRGLICAPLSATRAKTLSLDLMIPGKDANHHTAFTVSVDSVRCSTGISAKDRSETILDLCNDQTSPSDLIRPGHIFPLIAKNGGVLKRAGHTEAAVDLAKLAGLKDVGVICEIMNEDGTMARVPDLIKLSKKHDLKFICIKDLIEFRRQREDLVQLEEVIGFNCEFGEFKLHLFKNVLNEGEHHMALVKGQIQADDEVLVRVHSECFTGDIFGSKRCDCGNQLKTAMTLIEKEGKGVLLYMRQEGRGIGLVNKIKAYALQDQGHNTVTANEKLGFPADLREYGIGAQILKQLNVKKIRLLTNNPKKIIGLKGFDLEIVERVPLEIDPNDTNYDYLVTKRDLMGHLILGNYH